MSAVCSKGKIIILAITVFTTDILASSRLNVFGDLACLQGSGYVTPKSSDNGLCHSLVHIRSVRPVALDNDCTISIYSDPYCSYNATFAPIDKCGRMAPSVGSYSLDCIAPQADAPEAGSSSSIVGSTTSRKPSTTSAPPTSASSSSASFDPYSHIYATSPSSKPSPTTSSTSHSSDRSNGTGLNNAGIIATGVVIPTVGVIVAIIFGVRMWNRGKAV